MEITVYRQAKYEREDGAIIYRGEDTLPYVDDCMFLVADGLGGSASIRHTKVNRDVFNVDKIVDTLFHNVFEEGYDNPRFVKYVRDAFVEILGNEETYFASVSDVKKSGYYASRIIAALFIHKVLYDWKDVNFEEGFDDFFDNLGAEEQKKRLETLGTNLAQSLREQLRKVAENANLIYESNFKKLVLLGTTLCATVYSEDDSTVHAAYFVAGDSRPYVWTTKGGLAQLMPDQEGADGGMTNKVCANDELAFDIYVSYFAFSKKCILFNASDGCFDSYAFVNQLAFEKLLLDSIVQSEDLSEVKMKLEEFFIANGKHDDSGTMAIKIFGYDSFDELKDDCETRLLELDEKYFSKMPDLLRENYQDKYRKMMKVDPTKMLEMKELFGGYLQVKELCRSRVVMEKYPPYLELLSKIEEEIQKCRQNIGDFTSNIEEIVCDNYLKYYLAYGNELRRWDRSAIKLQDDENDYEEASEQYRKELELHKKHFDDAIEQIQDALDGLFHIEIPESFDSYEAIDFEVIEDSERKMDELFHFFEDLRKNKHDIARKLFSARKKYTDRNRKLAKQNNNIVQEIISNIISTGNREGVDLLPQEMQVLEDALVALETMGRRLLELENEKEKAADSTAEEYWNQNFEPMICDLIENNNLQIDEAVIEKAREIFGETDKEVLEIKEKAEVQEKLLNTYNIGYNKYLEV